MMVILVCTVRWHIVLDSISAGKFLDFFLHIHVIVGDQRTPRAGQTSFQDRALKKILYSNSALRQAVTVGHFCNFFLFHNQQNKFP